jgi:hypothetical protein
MTENHKYSVGRTTSWAHENKILIADHALDRWGERMPADAVSAETAWERSEDVSELAELIGSENGKHDSVRLYSGDLHDHRYWALFLIVDEEHAYDEVTTVLTWSSLRDQAVRAYIRRKAQQIGLDGGNNDTTT